jgi:hypothetical protein
MTDVEKALEAAEDAAFDELWKANDDGYPFGGAKKPATAAVLAFLRAMPAHSDPRIGKGYYYNTPGRMVEAIEKMYK